MNGTHHITITNPSDNSTVYIDAQPQKKLTSKTLNTIAGTIEKFKYDNRPSTQQNRRNLKEWFDLEEFADEIESEILDALKSIGCDTAKSVLEMDREDLIKRTNLSEEVVDEVISIFKSEFEN